ncbi:MAG: DUF3054 domain-containing protein [Anaerolineae bacterium]|nr:DUF3054 domain-containing protein [Anaerolineae bacterium]
MVALRSFPRWILAGDFLAILALSLIGFLFHNDSLTWRWLATFVPSLAGWLAIAPWLSLFSAEVTAAPRNLWRAGWAGFLAAPLAAWLRGLWLNGAISPVFVLVLGLTTAAGMLVWRGLAVWVVRRTAAHG